jgi:carbamoyl-phosphate synthase large subunit
MGSDSIIQEYLSPPSEEYTCGLYKTPNEKPHVLILKRRLAGGLTGQAEVVWDEKIYDYCSKIADGLDLKGSINIQLIRTAEGPIIFEINPRFSSTAIFRDHLGFKDVIWSIHDSLGESKNIDFSYKSMIGKKFYRVYGEIFA